MDRAFYNVTSNLHSILTNKVKEAFIGPESNTVIESD